MAPSLIVSHRINDHNGRNMTIVTMILSRKLGVIFMVTYLPTILMNMINQMTNYMTGDSRYDMIITVNITCMMVLASIYLSVSASLPTTSDIKPVEVWLIFNLSYPFITILVNVLLQVTLFMQNIISYHNSLQALKNEINRRRSEELK